jgi:small-conductance mechanosensitive channel
MSDWIKLVGPHRSLEIFGVKLVGVNEENGWKLLLSCAFLSILLGLNWLLRALLRRVLRKQGDQRIDFLGRQCIHLATAVLIILGLASIWFDDPARLATALGLVTAGLAFALQKVVIAIAGYFVILRGKTFSVGDRIRLGGVRGDVIDLGFIQTTIMEMGEPPEVQCDQPASWVQSRQYTGRIVTVSNARIFDEAVYNYTRSFPYIWEEMHLPIPYAANRREVERILLDAARRHGASEHELSTEVLAELQRRDGRPNNVGPGVYYRLTDNWLELTVRFLVPDHGIREIKDAMSRDILAGLEAAGISIASGTYDIIGLPPIRVQGLGHDCQVDAKRLKQTTSAESI